MTRKRCLHSTIAIALMVLHMHPAQAMASAAASPPAWLHWRVFHESLDHYRGINSQRVEAVLRELFALDSTQATKLIEEGTRFLGTLQGIDAEARATAQARYGIAWPAGHPMSGAERRIRLQPGKTLVEMVRADGLYQTIEARKQRALEAHMAALRGFLNEASLRTIQRWNDSMVAPRVKTWEGGTRVDRIPQVPAGEASWADGSRKGRR